MSCLLMVSWVIEVEYTLTAIPQLQNTEPVTKRKDHLSHFWGRLQHFQAQLISESLTRMVFRLPSH